eukprot:Nk52_evm17s236 gene=Nk52_evmTU17s236
METLWNCCSFLYDNRLTRSIALNVVRAGPLPKHVAFIMDGNRRFAKQKRVQRATGHAMGYYKLEETLQWCLDLGVKSVTVYAFSLENFNRTQEEVESIMKLALDKFGTLFTNKVFLDKIEQHKVRIKVIGELSLLPEELQKAIAKVVCSTAKNRNGTLNVCLAYTGRQEICNVVNEVIDRGQLYRDGELMPFSEEKVFTKMLECSDEDTCLGKDSDTTVSGVDNEIDLLVRTSGEVRLSDFLLWQTGYSSFCSQQVLWPAFSFWNLISAVLFYQKDYPIIEEARKKAKSVCPSRASGANMDKGGNVELYLRNLYNTRMGYFRQLDE